MSSVLVFSLGVLPQHFEGGCFFGFCMSVFMGMECGLARLFDKPNQSPAGEDGVEAGFG